MFQNLHALAQKATLMIIITAEGEQLRLSVTPTAPDSKAKPALRPLSLLGTPAELDEGFSEALAIWQAPKQSLADQARAAAAPDEDEGEKPAGKPAAKPVPKKQTPAKPAVKKAAKPAAAKASASTTIKPADKWPFPTGTSKPAVDPAVSDAESGSTPEVPDTAEERPDDAQHGTQVDGEASEPAAETSTATDDTPPVDPEAPTIEPAPDAPTTPPAEAPDEPDTKPFALELF